MKLSNPGCDVPLKLNFKFIACICREIKISWYSSRVIMYCRWGKRWTKVKLSLSAPWRCTGEQKDISIHNWPQRYMEVSVQHHAPAAIQAGKNSGILRTVDGMVFRAGLDVLEKRNFFVIPGIRNPYRPDHSSVLYWLLYFKSWCLWIRASWYNYEYNQLDASI
jgi:hypothetical protein